MKAATLGHVPREQRVGRASMKGRPIKSGDHADDDAGRLGAGASMKGCPIKSGDLTTVRRMQLGLREPR